MLQYPDRVAACMHICMQLVGSFRCAYTWNMAGDAYVYCRSYAEAPRDLLARLMVPPCSRSIDSSDGGSSGSDSGSDSSNASGSGIVHKNGHVEAKRGADGYFSLGGVSTGGVIALPGPGIPPLTYLPIAADDLVRGQAL